MIAPGPNNPYFRIVRGLLHAWVAALVLLLYPYTEDPAAPVKHLASAAFAAAACGVWALGVSSGKAPYRRPDSTFYFLLGFLSILFAAASLGDLPARSFDALRPWCIFALIAFVAHQCCCEKRHVRNLMRAVVASVTLSSLYGYAQYMGLDPFPWADRGVEEYRGLPATYGNPNLAGHAIVIAVVLGVGLLADAWKRGKRTWEPMVCAAAVCLMLGHLYLSGMRGGALALLFALFFTEAYFLARRLTTSPARQGGIALGLTGAVLAAAVVSGILLAPSLGLDSSLQLRLNGYAGAAAMFLDHWMTGIGPGNYPAHAIAYWTDFEALWYALENKRNFHVHNEWLEIAVAGGVPGLAAFIAFYLSAVTGSLARVHGPAAGNRGPDATGKTPWSPLSLAITAALVAIAVDALTGFNLHVPVSGALFMVLALQRPATQTALPVLQGYHRILPALSLVLALAACAATWRVFQAERLYQQARGALAWEARDGAGRTGHGVTFARDAVDAASKRMPWDDRMLVQAGDLEMELGNHRQAALRYEQALARSPYHPRIHVKLAHAQVRLAGVLRGVEREQALDRAASHASDARARCPELGDAWAMSGWAAFLRGAGEGDTEDETALAEAVRYFEGARQRGIASDSHLDAALGMAQSCLGEWQAAARNLEASVLAEPATLERWDHFHRAAGAAGGPWTARYRQALVFLVGRMLDGEAPAGHATIDALVARLPEVSEAPGAAAAVRDVLARGVAHAPDRLARWGPWLAVAQRAPQALLLNEQIAQFQAKIPLAIPTPVRLLAGIRDNRDRDTLSQAALAFREALATAPGGERQGTTATAYLPLLELLDRHMAESGFPPEAIATAWAELGAAYFEAGNPAKADVLLARAERLLPAAGRGRAQYYRARALLALGQPDSALAMARQAARGEGAPLEHRWQLARTMAAAGELDAARFLYDALAASLPHGHPYQPQLAREASGLATDRAENGP